MRPMADTSRRLEDLAAWTELWTLLAPHLELGVADSLLPLPPIRVVGLPDLARDRGLRYMLVDVGGSAALHYDADGASDLPLEERAGDGGALLARLL